MSIAPRIMPANTAKPLHKDSTQVAGCRRFVNHQGMRDIIHSLAPRCLAPRCGVNSIHSHSIIPENRKSSPQLLFLSSRDNFTASLTVIASRLVTQDAEQ
jgi:hypothetical protein